MSPRAAASNGPRRIGVVRATAALLAYAACLAWLAPPGTARAGGQSVPRPAPSAEAATLIDAGTGEVLFSKSPGRRRAMASTAKLMTALVTLERAQPGDVLTSPGYSGLAVESKIGLRKGERMRVSDLLEALLLESANDAAITLATGISGSRAAFVSVMNRRARQLGLSDTRFANPIGLDDPLAYSSPRDLASLSRHLMRRSTFRRIVDLPRAELESGSRERVVQNRNRLVARFPFVEGIKTGHTRDARYVLVGAASGRGARVISVAMGAPSESARDSDTLALLRFGLDRFRRISPVVPRRVLARPAVRFHDRRARLVARRRVALTVRRGRRPRVRIEAPAELEGPLPAGRRAGRARIVLEGRTVRSVPLVTAAPVPGAGPLRRLLAGSGPVLISAALIAMVAASMAVALRLRALRRRRDELAAARRAR